MFYASKNNLASGGQGQIFAPAVSFLHLLSFVCIFRFGDYKRRRVLKEGKGGEVVSHEDEVARLLCRLRTGDESARLGLLTYCEQNLRRLTRGMLRKNFPRLKRWEETDDVFQRAVLKLHRSLASVTPESPRHFYNLAALQIRRELHDLARQYCRPTSTREKRTAESVLEVAEWERVEESVEDPGVLAEWADFHDSVTKLPENEREVVNLLWYHGLSHVETSRVLGVDERTVRRRWNSARSKLREAIGGPQA